MRIWRKPMGGLPDPSECKGQRRLLVDSLPCKRITGAAYHSGRRKHCPKAGSLIAPKYPLRIR